MGTPHPKYLLSEVFQRKKRIGELFILELLFWTLFFKRAPLEMIIKFYSALHSFHVFHENKQEQFCTP